MEKLVEKTIVEKRSTGGEVVTFISMGQIEKARRDLKLSKIDESNFSDGEIVLAIKKQAEVNSATIVPIILDWLVESNFIVSGPQAANYLRKNGKYAVENHHYQTIGEVDFDNNGNYYLVVASSNAKKMEAIYKVYTNGEIKELVVEN